VTPLQGYFDRLVGYAVTAQWGRRPLTRVQAAERAAQVRRRHARLTMPLPAAAAAAHTGQVRARA
jgi:hypothetical protein